MEKSPNGIFLQRFVSARVVFVLMGFLGFCLVYAFKVVLNMSIVSMVKNPVYSPNTALKLENECPVSPNQENIELEGEFDWNENIKSLVLGSFFYGYVLTQIPAGILANKYGGKWIFGTSILITSIFSILGPVSARISYKLFIITRVGQGLAEGVVFPCMNTMIARWMPKMERTRGTTIIFTGSMIGTVITMPLAAELSSVWQWPSTFYVLGMAGIIWFVLWAILIFESPESHPYISQSEYDYILQNEGGIKQSQTVIPYREILTSAPVYALMITHFGQNWGFLTVLTLMPSYMDKVLHTNINQNILISGLPYLGQAVFGWCASYVSDKVRQRGHMEITTIRKINAFIAFVPPAICLILVPAVNCDKTLSCMLLILMMTFNGSVHSSLNSTHVDMAPDFAGTLMGLTNSFGNIPGFVVPMIAAQFTKNGQTVHNWSYIYYIAAGIYVVIAVVYNLFATAKEQSWGRCREKPIKI